MQTGAITLVMFEPKPGTDAASCKNALGRLASAVEDMPGYIREEHAVSDGGLGRFVGRGFELMGAARHAILVHSKRRAKGCCISPSRH
jgi:hypothetical protein